MQNRPTVLVRTNDTLISLAETYYLDPNIALLIADLNAGHIRDTQMDGKRIIELQSGQKLIMPIAGHRAFLSAIGQETSSGKSHHHSPPTQTLQENTWRDRRDFQPAIMAELRTGKIASR